MKALAAQRCREHLRPASRAARHSVPRLNMGQLSGTAMTMLADPFTHTGARPSGSSRWR